jgi:hypothetical protein
MPTLVLQCIGKIFTGIVSVLIIRCTAKLRKEMRIKDPNLYCGESVWGILGSWHANLIYINRRKCILFVNDMTLFNFIVPDVSRKEIRDLQNLFLRFLHPVLAQEGFSQSQREALASEYAEVVYGPTCSKSVLGSMNDMAFHYEHWIASISGLHSAEIPGIISKMNHMPMGALKFTYPIDAMRQLASQKRLGQGLGGASRQ